MVIIYFKISWSLSFLIYFGIFLFVVSIYEIGYCEHKGGFKY
jgi:hypothetical protein